MLQGPRRTIKRARQLRREMSLPERLLWRELRKRPNHLKFRKQHPSGPYVADFFCHEAKLVVEVDGEAHDRGDRPERDAVRDQWFTVRRLKIMRIPAVEVLSNLEGVVQGIIEQAKVSPEKGGDAGTRARGVSGEGRDAAAPRTPPRAIRLHHALHGRPSLNVEDQE